MLSHGWMSSTGGGVEQIKTRLLLFLDAWMLQIV